MEAIARDFAAPNDLANLFNTTLNSAPVFQSVLIIIILIINFLALYRQPVLIFYKGGNTLTILFLINNVVSVLIVKAQAAVMFYVLFEISAIPIFIIIIGWGYQPEKIKAGYSMLIYTVILASPVIISLILQKVSSYEWHLFFDTTPLSSQASRSLTSFMLMLAFLVKLPLYSLHLWLPLAHVEAPVFGSMILAGILLKFGGLGIFYMQSIATSLLSETIFCSIALGGLIMVSCIMLQLTDLKIIIAYTSVAHIRFIPLTLFVSNRVAVSSGFLIILTHAFSSSGIFFVAFLIYRSSNSRRMLVNKGGVSFAPYLIFLWLIVVLARLGTPPTVNLASEILCISVLVKHFFVLTPMVAASFVAARAVHLILYRGISQGAVDTPSVGLTPLPIAGFWVSLFHIVFAVATYPVLDILF